MLPSGQDSRKTAHVRRCGDLDVLGVARWRIVCSTPGRNCVVVYWLGLQSAVLAALVGAGYSVTLSSVAP